MSAKLNKMFNSLYNLLYNLPNSFYVFLLGQVLFTISKTKLDILYNKSGMHVAEPQKKY